MVGPEEIREEQIRMTQVRFLVDLTSYRLRYTALSREEALTMIEQIREEILSLFPDKGNVFDLVLRPRFMRFLNERTMVSWGILDAMN
jgi:hypothetical protein